MFDDAYEMVDAIKEKEREYKLCRMVAGYAWEWDKINPTRSIKLNPEDKDEMGLCWNAKPEGWIISDNAINEVGCIHSTQGFDLNYVGVILGPEIQYRSGTIIVDRKLCHDEYVVKGYADDETAEKSVRRYIINTYKVLMTRGIRGCYVYVCDKNLRDYLSEFIPNHDDACNP